MEIQKYTNRKPGNDRAWQTVSRFWHEDPTSRVPEFVQAVSHYWHGPEQCECRKIESSPCGAGLGSYGDKIGRGYHYTCGLVDPEVFLLLYTRETLLISSKRISLIKKLQFQFESLSSCCRWRGRCLG